MGELRKVTPEIEAARMAGRIEASPERAMANTLAASAEELQADRENRQFDETSLGLEKAQEAQEEKEAAENAIWDGWTQKLIKEKVLLEDGTVDTNAVRFGPASRSLNTEQLQYIADRQAGVWKEKQAAAEKQRRQDLRARVLANAKANAAQQFAA